MNVAFVNTKNFWGGGEKLHFEYAVEFKELGHNVFMVTAKNSPLYHRCKENNIATFDIQLGNLSFLNPLKYFRLHQFYKKENIEAIIISNSPDLKTSGIAARFSVVSKVVYLRGLAVPIKKNILNSYLFNKVVTHLVPNSYETKKTTLSNFDISRLENKTKVIYHGIDIKEFDRKETLSIIPYKEGEIILGNAGRLTPQKGHKDLIEVAKILKQKNLKFKLYIAGTGPLKEELEALAKEKGVQNEVIFLGFVEDMVGFMHSIDISVLSSIWEGFGYVIVEAMAAQKPVVAYNLSSNPEIIEDLKTGYLIEYPKNEEFAERILQLATNPILLKEMGVKGRQSVIDRFLIKDRTKEFEQYVIKKNKV